MTSHPESCLSGLRFRPSHTRAMRSTLINPAEASAVALRRTAAFNLSSCVALSDPDPSVRNWTPVLVRKHAARSVPVHTVLCNRSGRKVTKTPQATRSAGGGIRIHFHVCLSLISGSSLGLSAHVLDTQGGVHARQRGLIGHRENGRKQKRNFRRGSGDGRARQQDDEGGEEPIGLNRRCHHTRREGFYHGFLRSIGQIVTDDLAWGSLSKQKSPHST